MIAKQLPLTAPVILRDPIYRGVAFGPKDIIDPSERVHVALGKYVGRYGRLPREVICHPGMAVEIGAECMGVPVLGTGASRHVVLVGPRED